MKPPPGPMFEFRAPARPAGHVRATAAPRPSPRAGGRRPVPGSRTAAGAVALAAALIVSGAVVLAPYLGAAPAHATVTTATAP